MMRPVCLISVMIMLWPALLLGADMEVEFCPAANVWSYPAESERGVQSLLLQNVAIVNHAADPIEVTAVDIDLMQGSVGVDTRHIAGDDLKKLAVAGAGVQSSGMLKLLAFQFCGNQLIKNGMSLAGPRLKPGEALLAMAQPFVYRGIRDSVRVRVTTGSGAAIQRGEASLPIREGPTQTHLKFPLRGVWYIGNGPTFYTAHRWALPEEFGFDVIQLGPGSSSHRGDGTHFSDYYAYGQPILAAASGRVQAVVNNVAESSDALRRPGETDDAYMQRVQSMQVDHLENGTAAGNYVLIKNGENLYSLYAHLQPESTAVKAGDAVTAGQLIGLLGSSGNSTEPHLHFQVCDRPDPLVCAGIPVSFENVVLPFADAPRPLQSGDVVQTLP